MQTIPQRRVCVLGPLAGSSGLGRKSGTEKALVPTLILERLRTSSGRGLRQLPAEACRAVWALWPPGSERLGAVWLGSALPSCRRALGEWGIVTGAGGQADSWPAGFAIRLVFRARMRFALAGVCSSSLRSGRALHLFLAGLGVVDIWTRHPRT